MMKYLIALLILIFIAMVLISGTLLVVNKLQDWALEDSNEALAECNQKIIECNQLEVNRENLEAQIKYQEELEPINIYSEEELSEFYIIPTTEEAYVDPPKVEKICIKWKYYAWGNDVCQEYAYPL